MARAKVRRIRIPDNLTELAYKAIRESILAGDITVQDRLSEDRFATELGISKSPVREALHRLAVEGLIEISPRRGTSLPQYGPREVIEIFEFREAVEALAIRLLHRTPELISELRSLINRCEPLVQARDRKKFMVEDARFHYLLVEASGNRFLLRTFRNLQDHIRLVWLKAIRLPGRPEWAWAHHEHRKILQALEPGDKVLTERLIREHIQAVKIDLVRSMQESPSAAGNVPAND